MNNILDGIVQNTKQEVTSRKLTNPLETFIELVEKSTRSLTQALSNKHSDFIFECKKASPSKGLIRENFDVDLDNILQQYAEYASAISVLTDKKYFQGDFKYLTKASKTVKQPILCKDFFIDEYQIYEARFYGADAILLMLSVLDDKQYLKLADIAKSLDLDILTEVHDENELQRAIALDANIIGINNRNLKDLSIDLATTERLAKLISKEKIVISESGISSHKDIRRLSPHVKGFLVGSSIMDKKDIRSQCKELLYGNIKICGITRLEDAIEVDKRGANFAGFIFYQQSKRYIELEAASTICKQVPMRYVGVFVNEDASVVIDYATRLDLFAIQLHGSESDDYIATLRESLPNIRIWKAVKVSKSIDFTNNPQVDRYLLDTYSAVEKGGTGESFDWDLMTRLNTSDLILAGGIDATNINNALSKETYGLDLSSGVESKPGLKCSKKVEIIFNQLRA